MAKSNYIYINYPDDNYEEYDNLNEAKEELADLVDEKGAEEVETMLDDGDILIIQGEILEVEISKTVKVKIT
jgi:spore cortex formation protein SpoVR/YcgB (stage V sporulation)